MFTHSLRNNNGCIAYFLAKALTPSNAPALRRLTLRHVMETYSPPPTKNHYWRGEGRAIMNFQRKNYNGYKGPYLRKINLSQLEALNAPHFENFQESLTTASSAASDNNNSASTFSSIDQLSKWTALKDLTIDLRRKYDWSGLLSISTNVIHQLTSLTIFLGDYFRDKPVGLLILATIFGTTDDSESTLNSLTLKDVSSSLLDLVLIPYLMDTNRPTTIKKNGHLKYLRVDFSKRKASRNSIYRRNSPEINGVISFLSLTCLHLVNSDFLHG